MNIHTNIDCLANHTQYIEKIAKWRTDTWGPYNPDITYNNSLILFKEHCNHNKLPITYLYFENSEPVGMFSVRTSELSQYKYLRPWVGGIYVKESHRNKGIGSALLKHAEQIISLYSYEMLHLFIFNCELKCWYESLGYEAVDTSMFCNYPIILMKKNIQHLN